MRDSLRGWSRLLRRGGKWLAEEDDAEADKPERQAEEGDGRGGRLYLAGGERVEERRHDEQRRDEIAKEPERSGNWTHEAQIAAGEREKERDEQPARNVGDQRLDGEGVGVG